MKSSEIAEHLFKLPLHRLVDALDAIDELDMHILAIHQNRGDDIATHEWLQKMKTRREGRWGFLQARIATQVFSDAEQVACEPEQ